MDEAFLDAIMQELNNEGIADYSKEDLQRIAKEKGIEGLIKQLTQDATYGTVIKDLKDTFRNSPYRVLSDSVEDYFDDARARSVVNIGQSTQMTEDDRLGENLDHILANFVEDNSIELPFSNTEKLDKLQATLTKPDNKEVGEFLMRSPPPYLKLLMHYAKVKSFDDLKELFSRYESNRQEFSRIAKHYRSGPLRVIDKHPVEFFTSIPARKLEHILNIANVSSADDYAKLLIDNSQMTPFLGEVDRNMLKPVLDIAKAKSVDDFLELFEDSELRENLVDIDTDSNYLSNLDTAIKYFSVQNVKDMKGLLRQPKTRKMMQKAIPDNFRELLDIGNVEGFESLEELCTNETVYNTIGEAEYSSLRSMLEGLGDSNIKNTMYQIITNIYDEKIAEYCKDLAPVVKKNKDLKDFIIGVFHDKSYMNDNLAALGKILPKEGNYENLELLRIYTGGFITRKLGEEIISSQDPEETINNWEEILKSFNDGCFNPEDELHRNIEYIRYRSILDHEKMQRHLDNNISFDDYSQIFVNTPKKSIPDRQQFELECVAYEANLLHDYIHKVKQSADRLELPLMVVPNLSYGYLPVSAIAEELPGEMLIGAKVGSSQCHRSNDFIKRNLFEECVEKIINSQPVMVVVDGTGKITTVQDEKEYARYPDSHMGYLNHVIAINDSLGFDIDYSHLGKTKSDMQRLRKTPEFVKTVEDYKEAMDENPKKAYDFELWNTLGINSAIINQGNIVEEREPFNPYSMTGPTMIFCNIGIKHEQIPGEIKSIYPQERHQPAFFDDTGRIINFDFSFDNFGVRYLNTLEDELKRVYSEKYQGSYSPLSAFIKYGIN